MSQVLSELNKGQDVHAVDAALKRHEAISADIQAGEARIQVVRDIVRELAHEKFHDVETFRKRCSVQYSEHLLIRAPEMSTKMCPFF